jgi:hypothetical protein
MFSIWWVLGALVLGFYFGFGASALMLVSSRDPEQDDLLETPLESTTLMPH